MEIEKHKSNKELIIFTESANEHFKQVTVSANALGVRLALGGGGCAGFSYKWELVRTPSEIDTSDYSRAYDGWTFWLDKTSELYLIGSTVDKKVDISGSVIDIQSPLAASSCGCGESVSFKV
jgi:iron-sulfur cluster assembly accessory protein